MKTPLDRKKVCFVGAGAMAEAIFRGMIEKKTAHADHIFIVNRHNQNRLQELHREYGVQVHPDQKIKNRFIEEADVVVLAMKPKDVEEALSHLRSHIRPNQLVISVIAGLSIHALSQYLGAAQLPIVRTMPNTSSTIGLGVTGVTYGEHVTEQHEAMTRAIFGAVGMVHEGEEPMLDVITGISGSGPAYVYYFIENLMQAAIDGGIEPSAAKSIVAQTVLGAAKMVQQTGEEPSILRKKVTSPNGTTQAAIEKLDELGFPEAVQSAAKRSSERAKELGAMLEYRKS
ncbi:pyrroline-5-carboxylate reductase [Marinicrinis sediminis]|uniref:Pyrroline-5-carboxylate reductase n=1 Tax=Marinicrinis sediminis TaxID=1652465 RepID=A0ABW5RDX8_9BACL